MLGTANKGRYHDYNSQEEEEEEEEADKGDGDDQGQDEDPPWLTTELNCVYFPGLRSSPPHPEEALSHFLLILSYFLLPRIRNKGLAPISKS